MEKNKELTAIYESEIMNMLPVIYRLPNFTKFGEESVTHMRMKKVPFYQTSFANCVFPYKPFSKIQKFNK